MAERKITFESDLGAHDLERNLARALERGRLPGKLGLLQEVVGHWAVAHKERTWLHFGKAVLDTVGSVLEYRESCREVVEGEQPPPLRWLTERDYQAFSPSSRGLSSFARGALAGLTFQDIRVRNGQGELDPTVLKGFDLDNGATAYCLDPFDRAASLTGSSGPSGWLGPFCRPQDREALTRFLRRRIWEEVLGSRTVLLEPDRGHEREFNSDPINLSAVSDDFHFVSAHDTFNDVEALSERCRAFLGQGRSRTFLLHGPPGTGKSTLARAIGRALDVRVVLASHDAVSSLADATVTQILSLLEPGLVVLNDVDRSRCEEALALLQGLEGLSTRPLVAVLTVNDISMLDPAILRPGRIHEVREVPEPSRESRLEIVRYYAERFGFTLEDERLEQFLERSEGFSPADLREFAETAQSIGVSFALDELQRIGEQRALYAGDRCAEHNRSRPRGPRWRGPRQRALF